MFGLFFPRGRTPCGNPSVSRRIWQRWEKGRAMWWWWPGLASGSFRKNERPVRRNHSRYARDPAPQTSFLQGTPVLPRRTCSTLASGTALFLTLPHLHKNLQPPPRKRLPHFHRRRRRAEPAGRQARPGAPATTTTAPAKPKPFASSDTRIYITLAEAMQFQLKASDRLRGKMKEGDTETLAFATKTGRDVTALYTPGVTMAQKHGVPGAVDKKTKTGTVPTDITPADRASTTKVDAMNKDGEKWPIAFFEMFAKESKNGCRRSGKGSKGRAGCGPEGVGRKSRRAAEDAGRENRSEAQGPEIKEVTRPASFPSGRLRPCSEAGGAERRWSATSGHASPAAHKYSTLGTRPAARVPTAILGTELGARRTAALFPDLP